MRISYYLKTVLAIVFAVVKMLWGKHCLHITEIKWSCHTSGRIMGSRTGEGRAGLSW